MRSDDPAAPSGRACRVLFVDDEPLVIRSLRRALGARSLAFELVLAEGGDAASAELARGPVDVLVSDLHMPGLSGLELLAHAQRHHPTIPRILASGLPERELAGRLAPYAHFAIAKPFELEHLIRTVERALELRALLTLPHVRELVVPGGQALPAPPVFSALTERLAAGRTDGGELLGILEAHPSIAARTLGLLERLSLGEDPSRGLAGAAVNLEPAALRAVVLLGELLEAAARRGADRGVLDALELAATGTAALAARMVGSTGARLPAFAAGMLLDAGTLHFLPRAVQGERAATIGASMLGVFGMPWKVIEAVYRAGAPLPVERGPLDAKTAVRVARALVLDPEVPLPPGPAHSEDRVEEWRTAARKIGAGARGER